jgi:hypothetical protein
VWTPYLYYALKVALTAKLTEKKYNHQHLQI